MNKVTGLGNVNFPFKTAVCLGNFDGLHLGHRLIMETLKDEAQKVGGLKTVIFTLQPHPVKFFGKYIALLSTPHKRETLFSNMGIDYLVIADFDSELSSLSPKDFFMDIVVGKLNASIAIVGEDYRFGIKKTGDTKLMKKLGDEYGVKCVLVPKMKDCHGHDISSSRIRELLLEGDAELAAKFLGRPYSLEGEIVHGDGKGKLFGFPTINMDVQNELIPRFGVYASQTLIRNKTYNSMTYIGKRPTIGENMEIRAETNIFNFDEDVYGEFAEVFLLSFIRGEVKFSGIEELTKQMNMDMAGVKNVLHKNSYE